MRLDAPLRCHPALGDPTVTLYLTEGWLKADALASAGCCAVAILGTWAWGAKPAPGLPILADWEAVALAGRTVRVAYDSDTWRNRHVELALARLTAFLRDRGALVEWVRLPDAADGAKQGIDDWLAAGHAIAELEALVEEPAADPLVGASRDDIGNAERFAYENADRALWCPERRQWACWDGRRWDFSNPDQVLALAKATVRSMQIAAAKLPTTYPDRDAIVEHAAKAASRYRIEAMVALARPDLSVAAGALDGDPWLLNCRNGTLDLRTGTLRPHDPRDLIDKLCPVAYDPDARSVDWDRFLDLLTLGDTGVATHLQRITGYCLTGVAREGSIFFLLGPTRTGKTTVVNALKGTLGDYGWKAAFDTFLVGRRPGAVRDDIAAMEGKRLVVASEVSSGQRLDEAVVKELTGEDDVNARGLYERGRNFRPVSKLLLAANDFPHVRSDDSGVWARLNLIKCENVALQEREHLELKQRVMDTSLTGPAILAWGVEGCLDWQRDGHLARPQSVEQAVVAQREDFQPLKDFVAECCDVGAQHHALNTALRAAYLAWAEQVGEQHPVGRKRFAQELKAMGFEPFKSGDRGWVGLRLKKPQGAPKSQDGPTPEGLLGKIVPS